MSSIRCSIGMLTYNSEKNLARALVSVADFAEIIIADGGSTDATLSIARAAGARIISQSNPGHPISDFAMERNLTLIAATQPWFFYLDSDEIMSRELVEHIRAVTSEPAHQYGAYRVRYLKTNADASKIYRTYREYYQVRLVRTNNNAHFARPVHERIEVPAGTSVGQIEAPWYVPLDADDLSLRIAPRKIWKRAGMEAGESWRVHNFKNAFMSILGVPCVRIAKSLFKIVAVKIKYGTDAIPVRYELLRILYTISLSVQCARRL